LAAAVDCGVDNDGGSRKKGQGVATWGVIFWGVWWLRDGAYGGIVVRGGGRRWFGKTWLVGWW